MLFVLPIMSHDEQIQIMINQTMDSAISQIEGYLGELEKSNDILKISDSKESGPISEYEIRNCLIASMLVFGIIETEALFK